MSCSVRIVAVVVTYHPELADLARQLEALSPQVSEIVIVDNGSAISIEGFVAGLRGCGNVSVQSLNSNLGIGYAQNVGIAHGMNVGAQYVAIFDQDSLPAADMVQKLYDAASGLQSRGVQLAAVGPAYKDTSNGTLSGFVRVGLFGFSRIPAIAGSAPIEADFVISSGSLIPLETIKVVGDVDASLFIDHVDTEWCFRAKSHGYRLFGVSDALMMHSLGDRRGRIWFLRWRTVPYHSPFRYYYMFRNSVILLRRPYMPYLWKVADIGRCARALVYFGLFSSSRAASTKMMLKGVADGLRGITGKLQ